MAALRDRTFVVLFSLSMLIGASALFSPSTAFAQGTPGTPAPSKSDDKAADEKQAAAKAKSFARVKEYFKKEIEAKIELETAKFCSGNVSKAQKAYDAAVNLTNSVILSYLWDYEGLTIFQKPGKELTQKEKDIYQAEIGKVRVRLEAEEKAAIAPPTSCPLRHRQILHTPTPSNDTRRLFEASAAPSSGFSLTFSAGPTWKSYASSYRSTGAQTPADGNANSTSGFLCGGANYYYPIGGTRISYGGGVNLCGDTGGATTLFDIVRHPGGGHVTADIKSGLRVEPFIGLHLDFGNGPKQTLVPDQLLIRMGPVFAQDKISITSNQTGAGGFLETASNTAWTTGFNVTAGLSAPLCQNCIFGNPLSISLLGKATWFADSPSVSVTSKAFGFTESAAISRYSEYGLQTNFSVPFGMSKY